MMFGEQARDAARASRSCRRTSRGTPRVAGPEDGRCSSSRTSGVAPGLGEIGAYDVTLGVRTGEILGIAGVDGNGQRELAEAIAGQRPAVGRRHPSSGRSRSPACQGPQRERLGLRYVTDDRLGEGTVGRAVGGDEHRPQADRPARRSGGAGASGPRSHRRNGARADRRASTSAPRARDARRHALGRQHPEGRARARALVRPRVVVFNKPTYGLDMQDDAQRPRADPRAGGTRA